MHPFYQTIPPFKYWLFTVLGLLVSIFIIVFFIEKLKTEHLESIVKEAKFYNTALISHIDEFEQQENTLIDMLTKSKALHSFILHEKNNYDVNRLFYNIVKAKQDIMQLRFLDVNGFEQIRIDQDRDRNIKIISKEYLQDKSDRYYIKQFFKLKKGQTGYSDFDLNVENGVVERPFKPTIRIGKPVYINGEFKGIVVINYFMQDWLQYVTKLFPYPLFIIDKENNFMYHYDKKWEWSKYQNPPKTASSFPYISKLPKWQESNQNYFILGESLIGKKIFLFSNSVLVVYDTQFSLDSQLSTQAFEYASILLIAFLSGLLPFILLLYSYKNISDQNADYQSKILNNLFDALIVIDQKATIRHINKNTEELFGYSYNELIDHNVNLLVPEPYHSEHDSYVANYNKEARTIIGRDREIQARTKNGELIPISLAVTKTKIDNEIFFIGILRDIRDMKELEVVNKKQNDLLQQQSKLAAMGEMIGAIAHQWRQPLNELSIRIQKLKYKYLKEEVNEEFIEDFIEKNRNTINFMSNTIDDFRNFFRIDKEASVFDVKTAIEETFSLQNAQLSHHNIKVNLSGENFQVKGFKSEFKQVLINLLSNAKDSFLSNQIAQPEINITLKNNIIYIQDNAGGIPEDILSRVFEPYFTTKEQGEGTGMGLYLSKMMIEDNMHGKISIENKDDGVLVSIMLEYKQEEMEY